MSTFVSIHYNLNAVPYIIIISHPRVLCQGFTWQWIGGQDRGGSQVQPGPRARLLQPGAPLGCSVPAIRKKPNFTHGLSRVLSQALNV